MDRPNPETLANQFGRGRRGEVQNLHAFAWIPDEKLKMLADVALDEDWGNNHFALEKYLAEHVPLSVEQERYVWYEEELLVTAGALQTRYGTPVYLAFEKNERDGSPCYSSS